MELKKMNLVAETTLINIYSLSKNSDTICLHRFNPKDRNHLFVLSIAQTASKLYNKKVKIIGRPLSTLFLNFSKNHKGTYIIPSLKRKPTAYQANGEIDIPDLLDFERVLLDDFTFADIYNDFYDLKGEKMISKTYEVYTDGSCSSNGKANAPGGGAYLVRQYNETVMTGYIPIHNATNNIAELTAMVEACEDVVGHMRRIGNYADVIVYSDSAYIINCYKQGWYLKWQVNGWVNSKKEPVANRELWERLIPFFEREDFCFVKVAGHADNEWNNQVDKMAVRATEIAKEELKRGTSCISN